MYIPIIYLLLSAEIIFILSIFSIGLLVYVYKLLQKQNTEIITDTAAEELEDSLDLSTSYCEYIEIEVARNQNKLKQETRIEDEISAEIDDELNTDEKTESSDENTADNNESNSTELDTATAEENNAPNENQSQLLSIREMFLEAEKSAAEYQDHEIHFWDEVYKGMENISETLKTTIVQEHKKAEMDVAVLDSPEIKEKVFYIETQGKKVDGEVNKLKDIIFEQENALNSMRKTVGDAEEGNADPALIEEINSQIAALEAQISDSKMCMEVLEMENDRLQSEVSQLEAQYMQELEKAPVVTEIEVDSTIDLSELQDLVDKQEQQINDLTSTIDTLEIDAGMAETMKKTITDFAHSSQEMMGCISILEDENKHFKQIAEQQDGEDESVETETPQNDEDTEKLKSKLQNLEEEMIKKDVAFAKLQEEFDSIEKEYLSMYEAMHGDNG